MRFVLTKNEKSKEKGKVKEKMANEKENKNKEGIVEEPKNAPEEKKTDKDFTMDFTDPYADRRDVEEEEYGPEKVDDVIVFPTRVPLFRYLSKSVKTGTVYNNIRTAWKHTVKRDGKEEQMECEINFIVRSYGKFGKKSLYDIVNVIYGDKDSVLLYIQRRESERNGKKNVTWTPLISFTDDNDVTYTCQLSPSTDGDNAMWNLLLSILNKNGVINGYSPI